MIQSGILFILTVLVFITRKPQWLIGLALGFIALSMPLFALWIFFTAQQLIYFGFLALFLAVVLILLKTNQ